MNDALTVLIIDDVFLNIMILQDLLSNEGYCVLSAANGPEGRKLAREIIPDIILLDVVMPEEDGFETCKKLKLDPATADIPIIFISTADDTESKLKGLSIGGLDYIAKPFQPAEVLARVKNYLKLRFSYLRVIEEQAMRLQQVQQAQQALLVKPEELPAAKFAVNYLPILEAGGDFYDVFEISKDLTGYFVSDMSGHDIGASFTTSALKALVRQNSSQLFAADETTRMINSVLMSIFAEGRHLTAVYLQLNRNLAKMTIVNAGHLPVVILSRSGDVQLIKPTGDILGSFRNAFFECREVNVSEGDRFFLFTDGLIESMQPPRTREQGMELLIKKCLQTREMPLHRSVEDIVRHMLSGCEKPEDDVLLMGVSI